MSWPSKRESNNFDRICKNQTDRERILMAVAKLVYDPHGFDIIKWNDPTTHRGKAEVGDLVQVNFRGTNPWTFGWLEAITELPHDCEYTIRAVGSSLICGTRNNTVEKVSFDKYRPQYWAEFLEGGEYKFSQKCLKAFEQLRRLGNGHLHKFLFEGKREWKKSRPVQVEIKQSCVVGPEAKESFYKIPITYNSKTSVKCIIQQLQAAGFTKEGWVE